MGDSKKAGSEDFDSPLLTPEQRWEMYERTGDEEGANHYDTGKPRMDLLPIGPLMGAAKVFTLGAEKYTDHNWQKGMKWGRLYASLLRHVFKWWAGQDKDEETGEHHLDHALCCLMMLRQTVDDYPQHDDRPSSKQ